MAPQDKYSIDYQAIKPGKYNFDFHISDDIFTLWEESEVEKGELDAKIGLTKFSSYMELDFMIEGSVEVSCDRCLKNFTMPVQYKGRLNVNISDEAGEYDGETMWIHPTEKNLSLAQYMYESIMLSLPYERAHLDIADCDPEMLKRFKIVEPTEEEESEE